MIVSPKKNDRHISTKPCPPAMSGLTLIELMVAMSIGLVLIGGALYVYSQSSNSYRAGDSVARLQETARFALDDMEANIRHAGYQTERRTRGRAVRPQHSLHRHGSTDGAGWANPASPWRPATTP